MVAPVLVSLLRLLVLQELDDAAGGAVFQGVGATEGAQGHQGCHRQRRHQTPLRYAEALHN